jgi:hypothetical protein
MRLRLCESAIASRFVFSPKIRDPATFGFCNTIGHFQTRAVQQKPFRGGRPGPLLRETTRGNNFKYLQIIL